MILEFAPFAKKIERNIGLISVFDDRSLGIKLFLGILLLLMETLGNYLLFCMVWYEKFGMDSKKRTITNQLFSRMILALIFFNIFILPLIFGWFFVPKSECFQRMKTYWNNSLQYKFISFDLIWVDFLNPFFLKTIINFYFLYYRWIYIPHLWVCYCTYGHTYYANTCRNGDF